MQDPTDRGDPVRPAFAVKVARSGWAFFWAALVFGSCSSPVFLTSGAEYESLWATVVYFLLWGGGSIVGVIHVRRRGGSVLVALGLMLFALVAGFLVVLNAFLVGA